MIDGDPRLALAVRLIRDAVRESPYPFREIVAAWIQDAVARGLVRRRGEWAVAENPNVPKFEDVSSDVADRSVEYKARLDEDRAALSRDFAKLSERVADNKEVDALSILLRDGHAQSVAMRALGIELVEAGFLDELAANGLAQTLAVVAHGRGVPASVLAEAMPIIESFVVDRERFKPWFLSLQIAMFGVDRQKAPRDQVVEILDRFAVGTASFVPRAFQERASRHMKAATEFMRRMRVKDVKPEFQPEASRRGPTLSRYGAARDFAKCFGVSVPARESDARRRPKEGKKK